MAKFFKPARKGQATNWPLYVASGVAALTAEALIAAMLKQTEPELWVLFSLLTVACTVTGLVVARSASVLKADPRKEIASRAFAARVLSFALVLPSMITGASSMAQRMEIKAAHEYAASAAYTMAKQNASGVDASGGQLDSKTVEAAGQELERAIVPTQVRYDDPAFFGALLAFAGMLFLPILAVGHGITFAAETPAQEKRRLAAVRAAKAAATKAANAKAAKKGLKLATNDGRWVSNLR